MTAWAGQMKKAAGCGASPTGSRLSAGCSPWRARPGAAPDSWPRSRCPEVAGNRPDSGAGPTPAWRPVPSCGPGLRRDTRGYQPAGQDVMNLNITALEASFDHVAARGDE